MNSINEKGELLLETLGISKEKLTQQLVFDIISLQNTLNPYSNLKSREIHWKVHKKEREGGHFNIDRIRKRFFSSENQ